METFTKDIKSKLDQTNPDKREGYVASMIEEQTAKIPSDVYLWAALGAMAVSLTLKFFVNERTSLFIGQWASSLLILGMYNKLVKQMGHDSKS